MKRWKALLHALLLGDDPIQGVYFQGERGTNTTTKLPNVGPLAFTMIQTSLEANHTIKVRQAWIESPEGTILLGKRSMMIGQDKGCLTTKTNYSLEVIFSTCSDDEFSCNDGFCIDMTKRCDNIQNFPNDMSNEAECKLLNIPQGYKKDYAPTQVDEKGEVIKTGVTVSLDLTNILEVSEKKGHI